MFQHDSRVQEGRHRCQRTKHHGVRTRPLLDRDVDRINPDDPGACRNFLEQIRNLTLAPLKISMPDSFIPAIVTSCSSSAPWNTTRASGESIGALVRIGLSAAPSRTYERTTEPFLLRAVRREMGAVQAHLENCGTRQYLAPGVRAEPTDGLEPNLEKSGWSGSTHSFINVPLKFMDFGSS